MAVVQEDWYEFYLIDTHGNEIPDSRFSYIDPYYDYNDRFLEIAYGDPNECTNNGLYDTKTRSILIEPKTQGAYAFDDDHILVRENKISERKEPPGAYEHCVDINGNDKYPCLTELKLSGMELPDEDGYVIVSRSSYFRDDSLTAYYSVFGHKYDSIVKSGVLDLQGNTVIPIEYDSINKRDNVFVCQKDGVTENIVPNQ